jgi:hypothetical protein
MPNGVAFIAHHHERLVVATRPETDGPSVTGWTQFVYVQHVHNLRSDRESTNHFIPVLNDEKNVVCGWVSGGCSRLTANVADPSAHVHGVKGSISLYHGGYPGTTPLSDAERFVNCR